MEVVKKQDDAVVVNFLTQQNIGLLVAFFQDVQISNAIICLNIINFKNKTALLIYNKSSLFLIETQTAQMFELERFFANIHFFVETDRELATILHFVPLQKHNIFDPKLATILTDFSQKERKSYIEITINDCDIANDLNISFLKDTILRGFDIIDSWNDLLESLNSQNKKEIYESILAERFLKSSLYNTNGNELHKISLFYQLLTKSEQNIVDEAFDLLQTTAKNLDISISNIITLNGLEAIMLKFPQTFDELTNITGFNKRIIHGAIMRKILTIFAKHESSIKRNRTLELILETILTHCAKEHNIDKNLICSKNDIIAYLGGNKNVNFMQGWKYSVFGKKTLDFLENQTLIECKNGDIFFTKK